MKDIILKKKLKGGLDKLAIQQNNIPFYKYTNYLSLKQEREQKKEKKEWNCIT